MSHQALNVKTWTRLGVIVASWAGLIGFLAVNGTFDVAPTAPNAPTLYAILIPPIIGIVAYLSLPGFRKWVLALDPVLLISLQGWRILGGTFVLFYLFNLLPGAFAFPAGLGDVAIGVVAPFVAMALLHKPRFAQSRRFWTFHILGLFDFALAVFVGTVTRVPNEGWVDGVTSGPMGLFPLVLIPAFIVPAFILLHFASMVQAVKQVEPVVTHQPRAA